MLKSNVCSIVLSCLMLMFTPSTLVYADDGDMYGQQTSDNTQLISKYLLNLGAYFGYDLSTPPPTSTPPSPLLNPSAIQNPQQSAFETLLGSEPVNAASSAFMMFVPGDNTIYAALNTLANATFITPPYSAVTQSGGISVSSLIDQQPYQQDPVSQAVLNILGTPDYSYCMSNDGSTWTGGSTGSGITASSYPDCNYLYGTQIMLNIIGTSNASGTNTPLPGPYDFFTQEYNLQYMSQLNSNTLISPLLYTTSSDNASSGSSTPSKQNGIPALSQAQQAANFIRYATSAVAPLNLPSRKMYEDTYTAAVGSGSQNAPVTAEQVQAQSKLASYLTNLRVYAAQSSVGFGNLYYMLSKRLPQNVTVTDDKNTSSQNKNSQALSEFTMATWRLFNPDQSTKTTWLAQINNASSATVQKEMVALLAEINYQLYLNRQQEERLLLTNTMLLLQNARMNQPSADTLKVEMSSNEPSS